MEELRTDVRERFVRNEEFRDYKQSMKDSLAFIDKKHEELKSQVIDHEARLGVLES